MYLKNLLQDISILSIFKKITSIIGRYTEEIFATLIAFIFIFNAFKNMSQIGHDNKFAPTTMNISCGCHINKNMQFDGDDLFNLTEEVQVSRRASDRGSYAKGDDLYNLTKRQCIDVR